MKAGSARRPVKIKGLSCHPAGTYTSVLFQMPPTSYSSNSGQEWCKILFLFLDFHRANWRFVQFDINILFSFSPPEGENASVDWIWGDEPVQIVIADEFVKTLSSTLQLRSHLCAKTQTNTAVLPWNFETLCTDFWHEMCLHVHQRQNTRCCLDETQTVLFQTALK